MNKQLSDRRAWCQLYHTELYQFDKCLLQMVEVRKREEGKRKKG
ncbi:hypothetical protein [Okeania sp. SIO3B5]|nr:hypothetical protein [Okeania sp. SIO3B5]